MCKISSSKGLLTIIDSEMMYKDNANGRDIVNFLLSNVPEMQRKSQQEKTIIFNSPDSFLSCKKYDTFMTFEELVGSALPKNVALLCWWKREWFNNLSLAQAISLLTANHSHTIHGDWKYKYWDSNKIIDIVTKGIDNNLGEGSSILLFQTMKSAYKLNQDTIVNSPAVFEHTLRRMLSKDYANSIIDSIFKDIIIQTNFSFIGDSSTGDNNSNISRTSSSLN